MRACDACFSNNVHVLRDGLQHRYQLDGAAGIWTYQLLKCDSCGMGMVDPVPSLALVNTFYSNEYGNYQSPEGDDGPITPIKRLTATLRMRNVFHQGLRPTAESTLGRLVELLTGKTVPAPMGVPLQLRHDAKIFDLGYGSGAWLRMMKQFGYSALHGYDIDANSENAARLISDGISVSSGEFLNNDYEESSFDCIRMSHVFEHLVLPDKVLLKCRTMLKPGGVIVLSHPCFKSWIVDLGLDYSPALMLPMHLYHHTPTSTSLMLRTAGFQTGEIKPFAVMGQFAAMINNKLKANGYPMIPWSLFRLASPIYNLVDMITGRGDFISAWATRPADRDSVAKAKR